MYKVSSQNLFLVELTYTGLKNNLIIAAKTLKTSHRKAIFSRGTFQLVFLRLVHGYDIYL